MNWIMMINRMHDQLLAYDAPEPFRLDVTPKQYREIQREIERVVGPVILGDRPLMWNGVEISVKNATMR